MDPVCWESHPTLRRPLFVVAFEGWNDAGDAATTALDYLANAWDAQRFATISAEDFFDFTATRPQVRLTESGQRRIDWPDVELLAAEVPAAGHDVVLVRGVEPQLRWKTFAAAVVSVARTLEAELAVVLGALLADVPHSRPVRVSGTTDDPELAGRLGLARTRYEGPTGIVGVLHEALRRAGIPAATFWAAVPHYVHQVPSPKAALALVERSAALFGARLDPAELRRASIEYEREVSERVRDDEDAAAYVARLEEAEDAEHSGDGGELSEAGMDPAPGLRLANADELAAEVQRYLRDHHREG
ncbi:MAG: PAC2 family protein [Acidimicrobiales bacterium]